MLILWSPCARHSSPFNMDLQGILGLIIVALNKLLQANYFLLDYKMKEKSEYNCEANFHL